VGPVFDRTAKENSSVRTSPVPAIVLLILASAFSASAGEIRIAPFAGFVAGGTVEDYDTGTSGDPSSGLVYGLNVDVNLGPERWIQVLWNHQELDFSSDFIPGEAGPIAVNIDHFHVGGMYQPGVKKTRPFAVASAGLTVLSPGDSSQDTTIGFSFTLGGGADFQLGRRTSLRLEGRGWFTFADGAIYGACAGGCSIGFSGGGTFQIQGLAALVFRFPPS
jgi:hypothetical protein